MSQPGGPLAGVRVLEMAGIGPAPFAAVRRHGRCAPGPPPSPGQHTVEVLDQAGQGQRGWNFVAFAVDGDAHHGNMPAAASSCQRLAPRAAAHRPAHSDSGIGIQNVRSLVMLPRRS